MLLILGPHGFVGGGSLLKGHRATPPTMFRPAACSAASVRYREDGVQAVERYLVGWVICEF